MLSFEKVDLPVHKFGEISKFINNMELNQWVKITGFDSLEHLVRSHNSIYSGVRGVSTRLREKGLRIKCKSNKKELALYIIKMEE